jgi:16S rRNA (uracil1498-N3)-methyltransferase
VSETIRRAYLAATPLPGDRVDLDPDEAHHLTRVLRLKSGDALAVFDGKGGEWEATIESASREGVSLVVGAPRAGNVEPELRVTVFQALTRHEKIEWVLQKGTEIGVSAFELFASSRVEAPSPSPSRMSRFERIVMEACKQCGRRVLPALSLGALATPGEGVVAIILTPSAGVAPLGAVLQGPKAREVWLAVGPEGGFSEDEVDAAVSSGWKRASLGPRILRTETAGAIASAIVLHTWGDLGTSRERLSGL